MKKMETDIIVAAAGLSGLAAAISAAENGARVLVFEKSGTTGGAANTSRRCTPRRRTPARCR